MFAHIPSVIQNEYVVVCNCYAIRFLQKPGQALEGQFQVRIVLSFVSYRKCIPNGTLNALIYE